MKLMTRALFTLLLAMALVIVGIHAMTPNNELDEVDHDEVPVDELMRIDDQEPTLDSFEFDTVNPDEQESLSLHGTARVLAQKRRRRLTCNKFPRICGAKGSPGPHCCKKRCVNVLTDRNNCGMCGKKCKYNQMCCGGKCVNPSFNRSHCGGCNNRCKSGGFCSFGLCSYA